MGFFLSREHPKAQPGKLLFFFFIYLFIFIFFFFFFFEKPVRLSIDVKNLIRYIFHDI